MSNATLTLSFPGTDCWPDHALRWRTLEEIDTYNSLSGYTPVKVHQQLANQDAARGVVPGCGTPYETFYKTLSIDYWYKRRTNPENDDYKPTVTRAPSSMADSLSGHSVNYLAAQAMSLIVGTRVQLLTDDLQVKELNFSANPLGDQVAQKIGLKSVDEMPRTIDGSLRLCWQPEHLALLGDNPQSWETVNLIGHSRGGVVAIAVANLIALYLPHIKVNLIGLDPVPGTGDWPENMCTLPGSVLNNYLGIYAVDEVSIGFNAVVPAVMTDQGKRWDPLTEAIDASGLRPEQYQLTFSRGRHATIPGSRMVDGADFNPAHISPVVGSVGDLIAHLCQQRLRQWGVSAADIVAQASQIDELKQTINSHSDTFFTMRDTTYTTPSFMMDLVYNKLIFHKARGISSTSGRWNIGTWSYLETYMPPGTTREQGFSDVKAIKTTPHAPWQALTTLADSEFGVG